MKRALKPCDKASLKPHKSNFKSKLFFKYDNKYFQPTKAITMGSPISSIIAEYLQLLEEIFIRRLIENVEISHYKRNADDILIVFYQNKKRKIQF